MSVMDIITMFGWIFLTMIVTVSGISYMNLYSIDGELKTLCKLDTAIGCNENILLKDTPDNDSIMFELTNNFQKKIFIDKLIIYDKSLDGFIDISNCSFFVNKTLTPKEKIFLNGYSNFYDFEKCGIYFDKDKKTIFNIKIEFNYDESSIKMISTGEIITNLN
jgi:hypothetical protein